MNKLYIPKKLNVGFQPRQDTYTKKLAYVIYWDDKGKLRKETSWNSWRSNSIKPKEFKNIPTEGFVLNKKAGGYSSGWNHRQTYCRVYDPRGFEFEITIPNLLFILQECNAYKGKGLEGEFVYAWDGKDLALLPAHCKEYQDSLKFTDLQSKKIGVKDLVPGCYYKTKKDEKELMYLGNFNYIERGYKNKGSIDKKHVFYDKTVEGRGYSWEHKFVGMNSMSTLGVKMNDTPVDEFASILDEFSKSKYSGTIKKLEGVKSKIKFPNDKRDYYYDYDYRNWSENDEIEKHKVGTHWREDEPGIFRVYNIVVFRTEKNKDRYSGYTYKYQLKSSKIVFIEDGELITKSKKFKDDTFYTENEIKEMNFVRLSYELSNRTHKAKLEA